MRYVLHKASGVLSLLGRNKEFERAYWEIPA